MDDFCQSAKCVRLCVGSITFEPSDLRPGRLARWLVLTLPRLDLKVKVTVVPFLAMDELRRDVFIFVCRALCAEVVGATSSKGFLVPSENGNRCPFAIFLPRYDLYIQ